MRPGTGSRTHIAIAFVLAVLTAAAFYGVAQRLLPLSLLLPAIAVLALAQVTLQVLFYMGLPRNHGTVALFFGGGVVLAAFIAWVVWYLLVPIYGYGYH